MVGLGESRKRTMGDEHLLTDAARFQLPARYQVVKGPHGDGELAGSFFPVIQESSFHTYVILWLMSLSALHLLPRWNSAPVRGALARTMRDNGAYTGRRRGLSLGRYCPAS